MLLGGVSTGENGSRKEIETLMTKNLLVGNIDKRKKVGTSRSGKMSTNSPRAYSDMQKGWTKKKKRK